MNRPGFKNATQRGKIATDINEDLETSVCSEFISFYMLSNMLYINTAQKFVVGKIILCFWKVTSVHQGCK